LLDRELLFRKLELYGFTPETVDWFRHYFSDRTQKTLVNGILSDPCPINYGILQGSTLRPILFLIFVNGVKRVSSLLEIILYTDDTTICLSSPNLDSLFSTFNIEISRFHDWCILNKSTNNYDKTNYVIFHTLRRHIQSSDFGLCLGDKIICREYVVRYIGVCFDKYLSWNSHIQFLTSKLAKFPYFFLFD